MLPFDFYKKPLAIFCVILIAGCSSAPKVQPNNELTKQPELWPKLKPQSFAADTHAEAVEKQIDQLIKQMSVAQKVGQITQAEAGRITPKEVRDYHIGSVLTGGGGFLNDNKYASVKQWVSALDEYYLASMDTSQGGLAIPIIWGADAVHGHNKIFGATVFPHNIGLGATRNGPLVQRIGEITAIQMRATGMDWTFSPSLSVVRNDRWGRAYEGFSEDPQLVSELGKFAVLGYQGAINSTGYVGENSVIATAKHYIADGGTVDGVDRGNNFDDEATLIKLHAPPYFSTIDAGVLTIMASHSSWQGTRMHGEQYLLTDILKNRLGFTGMVVGDWNSHGLIEGCTNTRCPQALHAGLDMFMVPFEWQAFIKNTIQDVEQGNISKSRLDDAVRRVLRVKFRAGLMNGTKPSDRPHAGDESRLAAPEYKKIARQAVRESLVLLKNNHRTLPLSPTQRILVAGPAANSIPHQTGGWTLSWQGRGTTNQDFPNGTSIYQGIKTAVETANGAVELAEDGHFRVKPDVAIVVYGESPYSEWQGDIRHMGYQTGSHKDAKLLEKLQAQGIPTVSIFLSGRPMWVNRALNASDSFVAAWLPGTEGAGVADVLFSKKDGNIGFDFSGVLPFSWPRSVDQAEANIGDNNYSPLFPFGYGLSYRKSRYIANLPTDESSALEEAKRGIPIFVKRAHDPWEVHAKNAQGDSLRYMSAMSQIGAITLSEADQETQGDAIHGLWDGSQVSSLQVINPNANRNFTQVLNNDGALLFDARRIKSADKPVFLQMGCRGADCEAQVEISQQLNAIQYNTWQELSIPLACFAQQGVNFELITRAFALYTSGTMELHIANIRLEPGKGSSANIQCD